MKVSVIVPIYNVEKYLNRCLVSLAGQTFDANEYEVILIDDGSNDASGSIAKEFIKKHTNFKYCYKENGGQASARNMGIDLSAGEFLMFVDSDDWVDREYIRKMYHACCENHADIALCGALRAFEDGRTANCELGLRSKGTYTDISNVIMESYFSPWNKIYKRELFESLRFPAGITYEDFAAIPVVMSRAKTITVIEEKLYYYYCNQTSTIMTKRKDKKVNVNLFKAFSFLEQSELSREVLETLYVRYILSSAAWTMVEFSDYSYTTLRELVDAGFRKYPNIKNSKGLLYVGNVHKHFVKLLLNRHYLTAKAYVRGFRQSRKVWSFVRKIKKREKGN